MKICPYPFSRLQTIYNSDSVEHSGAFFPCCSSWFTEEYQKIPLENKIDDVWNGKAATLLREKILEGDFSFCNRSVCKMPLFTVEELETNRLGFIETPISKNNLEAIKNKNPVMPDMPSSLHLSADLRCNLSCKICRDELIPNTKELKQVKDEFDYVHRARENLEVIKLASGGEVFYSTQQRELLKSFNPEEFPKLKRIHLVSNGVLFNQKAYDDLMPGAQFIKDVSISIDAGTKDTYFKMRGPYWDQLQDNLMWISKMRASGTFDFFTLNFTVVKDNYLDIPFVVELGKKLKVDRILLQKFLEIGGQGYKKDEVQDQSIHLPEHPLYLNLLEILKNYKDDPIVYTLLDIEGFEQKIEIDVNLKKALEFYNEAKLNFTKKDYVKSLKYINESIALKKDDFKIYLRSKINYELGINSIEKNDLETSVTCLKESLSEDIYKRKDQISYIEDGLKKKIYQEQEKFNFDYAFDCYQVYINLFDSDEHLKFIGAFSLLNRKKGDEKENKEHSLEIFKEISETHDLDLKNNVKMQIYYLCLNLGEIYKKEKDFFHAIKIYETALSNSFGDLLQIKKELYYLFVEYGFKFKAEDKIDQTLSLFEKAKSLNLSEFNEDINKFINETRYYHFRGLGFFYQATQKYDLAILNFEKALETNLIDLDFCFSYGICLKRKKRYDEALPFFYQSIKLGSKTFLPELEIASIFILSNRPKEALEILKNSSENISDAVLKRHELLMKIVSRKLSVIKKND